MEEIGVKQKLKKRIEEENGRGECECSLEKRIFEAEGLFLIVRFGVIWIYYLGFFSLIPSDTKIEELRLNNIIINFIILAIIIFIIIYFIVDMTMMLISKISHLRFKSLERIRAIYWLKEGRRIG